MPYRDNTPLPDGIVRHDSPPKSEPETSRAWVGVVVWLVAWALIGTML